MKLDKDKLIDELAGHEERMKGPLWSKDGGEPEPLWADDPPPVRPAAAPIDRSNAVSAAIAELRDLLIGNPPRGVSHEYVVTFFERYSAHLVKVLGDYVDQEALIGAGLTPVPGITVREQLRLWETVRLSVAHKAELEADPDVRRERSVAKLAGIQRALLSQKTVAQSHEPGQGGYSEVRAASGRLPIKRWFRLNADRLTQIADEAQAAKYAPTARRQVRLLGDLQPAILGQMMLPKGSVWDIGGESRAGSFFYGWEVLAPGKGWYIIPEAKATPVEGPASEVQPASHPDHRGWRVFTDAAGTVWAVRGAEAISASDLTQIRKAVDALEGSGLAPFEQTLDEFRASPGALLVPADSVLGVDPERETVASLSSRFSLRDLQVAARVTGVPHTGTKSEIAGRLVQVWLIRKELSLDTVDSLEARPGTQLRRYLEALHLFKGANKRIQAVTLLNWRDQARAAGKSLVAKGKWLAAILAAVARGEAIPAKVRQDVERRGEEWVLEPPGDES